jgi:hypothetical protein
MRPNCFALAISTGDQKPHIASSAADVPHLHSRSDASVQEELACGAIEELYSAH